MLYMHYCQNCHHIHMLNGHKASCPTCGLPLKELNISYLDYSDLNRGERETLRHALSDPDCLKKHTVEKAHIIIR